MLIRHGTNGRHLNLIARVPPMRRMEDSRVNMLAVDDAAARFT
jgi:hypothetical protein